MSIVRLSVPLQELSSRMAEMRMWLDERRVEPAVFSYSEAQGVALVRVEFSVRSEADAFARRFGGDRLPAP